MKKNLIIKLGAIAIMIIGLIAATKYLGIAGVISQNLQDALAWIQGLGYGGAIIFITIYIVATVFLIPGTILTLGAGFVFGVIKGSILVSIASTLGATAAFLVGRYFIRGWVAGQIERQPKFKAIDEAVAQDGWKIVGLTRLSPIFPFNFLNYAFSVTQVSLQDYILASWIGMMPGTVMYVYFGSLAQNLASLSADVRAPIWLQIIGFIATVLVTVYVTKIAKKALDSQIHQDHQN
jgi:uncharacterized membrane protein YdjX (TVP38/TMEM64 family)